MVTGAKRKQQRRMGVGRVGCCNLKQGGREGLPGNVTSQEEFQEGVSKGVSHVESRGSRSVQEQEVQRS